MDNIKDFCEQYFTQVLVLMNVCVAMGWVRIGQRNLQVHRTNYFIYSMMLSIYFLIIGFIHYDAYIFHRIQFHLDLFLFRVVAGFFSIIGTFGFVLSTRKYEQTTKPGIPDSLVTIDRLQNKAAPEDRGPSGGTLRCKIA